MVYVFTFLTLTYNHEKCIIEHLESIKYQIENHANDRKVNIIICDDASTDNTVLLIEKWFELNKILFNQVTISVNPKNLGVVKNYFNGINAVKTEKFKCLAGDDIYFINNVFDAQGDYDFAFSYPIVFSEEGINCENTLKRMYRIDCVRKNTHESVRKFIKKGYTPFFGAPAIFYDIKILQNEDLQKFVGQYKWIEDLPTYHHLFVMNKNKDLKITILDKAYVLYRNTMGISKKKHSSFTSFDDERVKMYEQLDMKLNPRKYLIPELYSDAVNRYRKLYIDNKIFKKSKDEFMRFENEMKLADIHYEEIKKRAINFYENISFEVKKD